MAKKTDRNSEISIGKMSRTMSTDADELMRGAFTSSGITKVQQDFNVFYKRMKAERRGSNF